MTYNIHHHYHYPNIPYHRSYWNNSRRYSYNIPYSSIYWDTWIRYRVPVTYWDDGFRFYESYPYYIYNGYLHRYSNVDRCDYELVDGWTNESIEYYDNYQCNLGYDLCADDRDYYNRNEGDYRYFCSERFYYDESHDYDWNFDQDFYWDI